VTLGEDEDRGLDCFLRMEEENLGRGGQPRRGGWVEGVLGERWKGFRLETEIVSMWSAIWRRKVWGNLRSPL
jgi:hypothetical protein